LRCWSAVQDYWRMEPGERGLREHRPRLSSLPLWAQAIGVYLLIHAASIPTFVWAWMRQGPNRSSYSAGSPDFWTFMSLSWDGVWYHQIATVGYPPAIPTDPVTGAVQQSAWAFFPLFPTVVRLIMAVTGLPFVVASPLVAFVAGGGASVLVALLVRDGASEATRARLGLPLLAVAALAAFPTGALAMVGYSEALALLLISAALLLISRRWYGWACLPMLALGFTRAIAMPMLAVVIWHGIQRFRSARATHEPITRRSYLTLGALAGSTLVSGIAWPLVVAMSTGVPNAYFVAQSAWRRGNSTALPFVQFSTKLSEWLGQAALPALVLIAVAICLLSLTRPVRSVGPELQAWGAAYLVFLLAVTILESSFLRYVLLSITAPLALVAWSRRRWLQIAMIVVLMAMQALWIARIWVFDGPQDSFPP